MQHRIPENKEALDALEHLSEGQHVYVPVNMEHWTKIQISVNNFARRKAWNVSTKLVRLKDRGFCLFAFRHA